MMKFSFRFNFCSFANECIILFSFDFSQMCDKDVIEIWLWIICWETVVQHIEYEGYTADNLLERQISDYLYMSIINSLSFSYSDVWRNTLIRNGGRKVKKHLQLQKFLFLTLQINTFNKPTMVTIVFQYPPSTHNMFHATNFNWCALNSLAPSPHLHPHWLAVPFVRSNHGKQSTPLPRVYSYCRVLIQPFVSQSVSRSLLSVPDVCIAPRTWLPQVPVATTPRSLPLLKRSPSWPFCRPLISFHSSRYSIHELQLCKLAINAYQSVILQTRLNIQDIAMPVAMPSAPAGGAAAPVEEEKPVEKTEFKVKLEKIDPAAKAKVIREVKNLTGMNLVEVLLQHLVVFYVSRLGMYLTFS